MSSLRWHRPGDVKIRLQLTDDVHFSGRLLRKGTHFEATLGVANGSDDELTEGSWILSSAAILEEGRRLESGGLGALADRLFRGDKANSDETVLQALVDAVGGADSEQGYIRGEIPADFGRILVECMVALQGQTARKVVAAIDNLRNDLIARLGLFRRPAIPAATVLDITGDWSGMQPTVDAYFKALGHTFIPAWRSHYWWCGKEPEPLNKPQYHVTHGIPVVLPAVNGDLTVDLRVLNAPTDTLSFLRSEDWTLLAALPVAGRTTEDLIKVRPDPRPPGCGSLFDVDNWPVSWLMRESNEGKYVVDVHDWLRFTVRLPQIETGPAENWIPPGWKAEIPKPFGNIPKVFGWLIPPTDLHKDFALQGIRFAANNIIALNILNLNSLNGPRLGTVWGNQPQATTEGESANGIPQTEWEFFEGKAKSGASVKSLVPSFGGSAQETDHAFYSRCAPLIRTRGRPYGAHDWEQLAINFDPRARVKDAFARPAYRRGVTNISLGVEVLIICDNAEYRIASGLRHELEEHLNSMAPLGLRAWVLVPRSVTGKVRVEGVGGIALDEARQWNVEVQLGQELLGGRQAFPIVRELPYWRQLRKRFIAGLTTSGCDGVRVASQFAEQLLNDRLATVTGLSPALLRIHFVPSEPEKAERQLAKEFHLGVPTISGEEHAR